MDGNDTNPDDTTSPSKPKAVKKSAAKSKRPAKPSVASPWTFPKNSLEEAITITKAIEAQNAGNPMKADMLVLAVGYKKAKDWRFQDLLRSANQYGLVSGSGATATVRLEQIGQDIIAPGSPQQRQEALLSAFRNVDEFRKVEDFYQGKKLPENEFFENTLVREFSIPRDRVKAFIDVFTKNLNYLRAFRADVGKALTSSMIEPAEQNTSPIRHVISSDSGEARTYLDTCFVMMPFGPWLDVYYKDVFSPAIKDAGMEPVRADELFSTGTVIEQIWEQIQKAKILLADLSGKNANVFYELGLCHAAQKPVVFTTCELDDVPFDLRHLRVVVYDVRDPFWGTKLKTSLTAYLKAAMADPAKSVPQPFRDRARKNDGKSG